MKSRTYQSAVLAVSLLCVSPCPADVYFEEDFEGYFDDVELQTDGGWLVVDENNPVETSAWTILNPGGRGNPPGEGGEPDFGQFAISDSDAQGGSNPTGSGMSHDIWSPVIEVDGGSPVWLHCDCLASLNNNGKAVFDVDVSTDEGTTWTNVFRRVAPSRFEAEPLASIDNVGGFFGRLHVDLTAAVGDETEFLVRWRHFEPNFDWWIAIDNVLIDDVAPPSGGSCNLLARTDFASGIPEGWVVSSSIDPPNSGTESWHTTDKGDRDIREHNDGNFPYQDGHSVGRLRGPFAILDSDADPDPAEDEWLLTPVIDCSDAEEVFLHYREENNATGGEEVLLSLDGGVTFEPVPIFSYGLGAGYDTGEEPFYAERLFAVPLATAESEVVFAFHYTSGGNAWWWAVDDVRVSARLIDGAECPCNCTTRGFSAGEFDASNGTVSLSWSACDDDVTHRVLRNSEVISGDLTGDVTDFVDTSPEANAPCPLDPESEEIWAVYTLQSLDAAGAELTTCGPVCVEARTCPKNLSCCFDREAGEVTLQWTPGVGVDGVSWRIRRNGLPRSSLAIDSDSYSESAPGPGTYVYMLELNRGNPQQCPDLPLTCTVVVPGPEILLYEDFECYTSDDQVVAAGWQSLLTNDPPADGSEWRLGSDDSSNPLGNFCGRGNPPTADGTPSQGKFLISDNDCGGFTATQGSGQSYDLISPTFDAGDQTVVWLHMDCTAVLNNNGEVVVDIDVSADGGDTWTNHLRRVGAARGAVDPFPLADIPDGLPGGPQVGNADGIFGRIHLDISDVAAGQSEVMFRVRHFEPSFDWWVAIDNVVVDSNPVVGGNLTLLESEGFDDDDLPDGWEAESFTAEGLAPWRTSDPCGLSLLNSAGGIFPDAADGRQLHHFDENFAHVFGDTQFCGAALQDEILTTPSVDASAAENVYLHVRSSIVFLSSTANIVVSLDGGSTFDFDNPIFSYSRGGGFYRANGNAEVAYGEYILEVPRAAGESDVVFGFHYADPDSIGGWWAIDDVSITADGEGGAEVCDNGSDDDGDDLVDCDDPDCAEDPEACPSGGGFVRGDSNSSGMIDLTDGVVTLNFLFTGGPPPSCLDAADTDDNGGLVISDAVVVFSYLFTGGPAPVEPSPSATAYRSEDCRPDPTDDDALDCSVTAGTCE